MTERQSHPDDFADLRRRAEELARGGKVQAREPLSPKEAQGLLHDLQVHQIELEMQNEELRRAQSELEASRARYFDLYDLAPVGYFTISEQGLILEANLTGAGLLGVARSDLARQPLTRFIPPEHQDVYYHHRKQLFEMGAPQAFDLQMLRAGAAPFWARWEMTEAQVADGATACRAAMSDVTARKQIEQELAAVDRRKDQFLAMLSHELRNPLAPILNAVQLLQLQKGGSPIQQKALDIIERQVEQLTHLVGDLLDVSRAISGKIQLRQEPVAMTSILERAVETVRPLIDQHGHELTVSLPPEPIWLYADPSRLEQVVTNLLTNAAKYTNRGGRIWLSARQESGNAVLCVRDTGLGIDRALLPHVFDMFTQAERSSDRSQGGLGLGLTVSKRLVEMHGGTIGVTSALGQGSEFVVTLALCPPDKIALTTQQPPLPRAGKTVELDTTSKRALRVLVVDDNKAAARVLEMLIQTSGHNARLAHNGSTALAAAPEYRPDVMLVDIGLPDMEGFEVARRIRQQPDLREIVLVAITGYGQDSDRLRSKEAGFDHHLVKPADYNQLRQIFAAAAAKACPAPAQRVG